MCAWDREALMQERGVSAMWRSCGCEGKCVCCPCGMRNGSCPLFGDLVRTEGIRGTGAPVVGQEGLEKVSLAMKG